MPSDADVAVMQPLVRTYLDRYPNEAARVLDGAPPSDIAALLKDEAPSHAARVLEQVMPEVAAEVLAQLDDESLKAMLPAFDLRRLASLAARLSAIGRERVLGLATRPLARDLQSLTHYREGTAGQIMDPGFFSFRADMTVAQALERLQTIHGRRVRDLPLVDDQGLLLGVLPLHEILRAEHTDQLRHLMRLAPPVVSATASKEEVLAALTGSGLTSLPVVDFEGRLIGMIRYDALVQAARDDAAADMQTMVGVSREERALAKPLFSVSKRLPWLNINLLTAFLAASVVGLFEDTIARFTALAVLLPVVAGQSGNTGAQALAVTMRGLALKEIGISHWPRIMWKEMIVGAINGVAIALVTMLGVYIWSSNPGLSMVIGLAMVMSMAIASVSGMAVPIVLTALKQDPAQSSSIILTTVTDVMGFLSFLGLATLFASML